MQQQMLPIDIELVMYLVGEKVEETDEGPIWIFHGMYADNDDAIAQCTTPQHFTAPVVLNQPMPEGRFRGMYFPLQDEVEGR